MLFRTLFHPIIRVILLATPLLNAAQFKEPSPWADWLEPNTPFFSSLLDARNVGDAFPSDNLTPRGLIINLGNDCWACFDTDLLRVAAFWRGKSVPLKPSPQNLIIRREEKQKVARDVANRVLGKSDEDRGTSLTLRPRNSTT